MMMSTEDVPRKGARSLVAVGLQLRESLECGAPSATHIEQMAIRMDRLIHHEFPESVRHPDVVDLRSGGFIQRMRLAGQILADVYGRDAPLVALRSSSDTARGWGAFAAMRGEEAPTVQIEALRVFADDSHFSVREMAWLALRPTACLHPLRTIEALTPLTKEKSAFVRRFASEASRPRSVWGRHIILLKHQPWVARAIVDPLRADESRYVQKSVGNWLNDAARDNPAWVVQLLDEWQATPPKPADDVIRRATRGARRRPPES